MHIEYDLCEVQVNQPHFFRSGITHPAPPDDLGLTVGGVAGYFEGPGTAI